METPPPSIDATGAAIVTGAMDNPLDGWPNDDLLLGERHRAFIQRSVPDVFPLLDWPELRALFSQHDHPAGHFRKRSRRAGLAAVALGYASLLLAAFSPLVTDMLGIESEALRRHVGLLICGLALAGGVLGYALILFGKARRHWLTHRFWTERIRQFNFQFILNNLPLAADILTKRKTIASWREAQARSIDALQNEYLAPLTDAMNRMSQDIADTSPWILPHWNKPKILQADADALAPLLVVLGKQRIDVQRRYTALKMKPGFHSPPSRKRFINVASDVLTITALLCAAGTGYLLMSGHAIDSMALKLVAAISGAVSGLIISLRACNDGLQLGEESERLEWYAAAIDSVSDRFHEADNDGKVDLLAELENLSYQELRRFIASFMKSRFVV